MDSIHLSGAEDVRRAAGSIGESADTIRRAADSLSETARAFTAAAEMFNVAVTRLEALKDDK